MKARIVGGEFDGVEFEVSKETSKNMRKLNFESKSFRINCIGSIRGAIRPHAVGTSLCPVALGIEKNCYCPENSLGFNSDDAFTILHKEELKQLIDKLHGIYEVI